MRLLSKSFARKLRVYIDQHTLRRLALAGIAGDGISMVEMRMMLRIEFDFALIVQPQPHRSIPPDALHSSQVTIGDLQFLAGRGELDAISYGEPLLLLSVDRNSNLAARVIGGLLPIPPYHGQSVRLGIHSKDAGVFALLDAGFLR